MRLLAITPGDGRDLTPWLEAMGKAGLREVLIREPELDAEALDDVCDEAMRWVRQVIVHTRNPHATEVADQRGLWLHTAAPGADFEPPTPPFGCSCHDAEELERAFASGARYALLSPVWPTSKVGDDRPTLGLAGFERIAAKRPVYALGGVRPAHGLVLREIGAHGAAAIGGLFNQPSPAAAAQAVQTYLGLR